MKLLGLNSPEIFIILVVLLSILGPKRIEKGFILFKKILKFLLSKEERTEAELKSKGPEESDVKEERTEAELKSKGPEESDVKEEKTEAELKSKGPEESDVKEEKTEAELKSIKSKKSTKSKKSVVNDKIIELEINSDNK